jgi:hypothetical protein
MNKKVWLSFAIVSLLALTMVSAVTIEKLGKTNANSLYYNARCEVIRPATQYRPEKSFGFIGVYGRLSNGEQICFLPSMNKRSTSVKPSKTVCEMQTTCSEAVCNTENTGCQVYNYETVCETLTECKTECHKEKLWKKTCDWKHGKLHCDYGWVWENVCKEECQDKEVCHEEQTTCSVYNTETTCTEPLCKTEKVCTKR